MVKAFLASQDSALAIADLTGTSKPRRHEEREDTMKFSTRRHGQPSTSLAALRPTRENTRAEIQEAQRLCELLYFRSCVLAARLRRDVDGCHGAH